MRRKILFALIFLMTALISRSTSAMTAEERNLICAFASMAAYSSETSATVREELKSRGWTLEEITAYASKADAKTLLLRRSTTAGRINILSICGTEDQKDAEIDLRVKLVPFDVEGGSVHQGFADYAEVLLSSDRVRELIDEIETTGEKLYLTGHSLGGAAALMTAARLTERGLGDRLEVITFGAPAVGDRYFVEHFNGRINIARITVSGDPIKKSLRALGYMHLGEAIKFKPAKSVSHFRHKMAVYLDCALRNYYDADSEDWSDGSTVGKIYAAPIRLVADEFNREDEKYIGRIMRDALTAQNAGVVFDPTPVMLIEREDYEEDFTDVSREEFQAARAAGCDRVLIQLIRLQMEREARRDIEKLTLERIVCDLKGFPLSMQTSSMSTNDVTALEALLFAQWRSSL